MFVELSSNANVSTGNRARITGTIIIRQMTKKIADHCLADSFENPLRRLLNSCSLSNIINISKKPPNVKQIIDTGKNTVTEKNSKPNATVKLDHFSK